MKMLTIHKDQSPKFRGELMTCALCGKQQQSSDQTLTQWSWYTMEDLRPWGLYYCPAEPIGLLGPHFLKAAEEERKKRLERYQT